MGDNTGQSPNVVSMLGQRQRLGECHVFADVLPLLYSTPNVGLVWGQRRRQLTGIVPVMGCDAGPTLIGNWVV